MKLLKSVTKQTSTPVNSQFLIMLFLTAVLSAISCTRGNNAALSVAESLHSGSMVFEQQANAVFNELTVKLEDIRVNEAAQKWHPIAYRLKLLTDSVCSRIEEVYNAKEFNGNAIPGLFQQLSGYADSVRLLSNETRPGEGMTIPYSADFTQYGITGPDQFNSFYFSGNTPDEKKMVLGKFLMDIRSCERLLMVYYNQRCFYHSGCSVATEELVPHVIKNSSVFKPGEELVIKAGIGGYNRYFSPEIKMNGRRINTGPAGYAIYNRKVPAIPGEYAIPVTIRYLNQFSGTMENCTTVIKYTVVQSYQ